jgi:hypothetical protein
MEVSMPKGKIAPSKKSANRSSTDKMPAEGRSHAHTARAHRDDTPEARSQRARTAKTHPTRSPVQVRKDSAAKHPKR